MTNYTQQLYLSIHSFFFIPSFHSFISSMYNIHFAQSFNFFHSFVLFLHRPCKLFCSFILFHSLFLIIHFIIHTLIILPTHSFCHSLRLFQSFHSPIYSFCHSLRLFQSYIHSHLFILSFIKIISVIHSLPSIHFVIH